MQEQKDKKVQSYQPLAKIPNLAAIGLVAQLNLPISTGFVLRTTDLQLNQVDALTFIAEHLAMGLAQTLSILEVYDKPAIYRIVSILEPYMEATQELDLHMPPISSRRVTVNVTDRGRAKPDLYIE
jgi:hypothetical protein